MPSHFSLIFETSTPQASLALAGPDGIIEQRKFRSDRNHNAVLFGPLTELLDCEDARDAVTRVIVGTGPGSYSGTRVGIAAAQGVGIALGCPVVGVPSILAVPSGKDGRDCLAIGDARRGSFWSAQVKDFQLTGPPELGGKEELERKVTTAHEQGIEVFTFEDPTRFQLQGQLSSAVKHEFPDAGRLWQTWLGTSGEQRREWAAEIPQPIYLKPPHITPAKRPWLVRPT